MRGRREKRKLSSMTQGRKSKLEIRNSPRFSSFEFRPGGGSADPRLWDPRFLLCPKRKFQRRTHARRLGSVSPGKSRRPQKRRSDALHSLGASFEFRISIFEFRFRRKPYGFESMVAIDCRSLCSGFSGLGLLGQPEMVSLYRFRGTQSAPVGLHELVPDDELPAQARREAVKAAVSFQRSAVSLVRQLIARRG